tara:strand:+ start:496 stop:654 length:159 start_codon:yes stop_codon:yes gene_type:complete
MRASHGSKLGNGCAAPAADGCDESRRDAASAATAASRGSALSDQAFSGAQAK